MGATNGKSVDVEDLYGKKLLDHPFRTTREEKIIFILKRMFYFSYRSDMKAAQK